MDSFQVGHVGQTTC